VGNYILQTKECRNLDKGGAEDGSDYLTFLCYGDKRVRKRYIPQIESVCYQEGRILEY